MCCPVVEQTIPAMLRRCVNLQPDDTALTFIDYEQDWAGVAETLTWYQLYRRMLNVARELKLCASAGDRAVILAPQGLHYIAAFLGSLQAGIVAVPLSVPQDGTTDQRVVSVMRDASPAVVLTTSSIMGDIAQHVTPQPFESPPSIIEVDRIDLDSPIRPETGDANYDRTAYLQYTSGSTRMPAGVMITHKNILANYQQMMAGYFAFRGGFPPIDGFLMSWLPFYHDMGLVLGICAPVIAGLRAVLTSPMAFLQRPARWMQLMAGESPVFSAAPNFAFELAAEKTSDDDLAGYDLGRVVTILSGSERVQPLTLERFAERFARFNLDAAAVRPSYGLAEATVYVATSTSGKPPKIIDFDSDELPAGQAKRCTGDGGGTPLVCYDLPESPTVRIVDSETQTECPEGVVGEIWVYGDNVAAGYWSKPAETERTFGGTLVAPSAGTPEGPWLRTGDSGFVSEGELFIIGRIKDLLIVRGRNHSPDDIEATIQEITQGRCVAIAVPDDVGEKLVTIIEVKRPGASKEDVMEKLRMVKREVTAAISTSHGLSVSDLVLVSPGAIPITTSGKVRRSECVKLYRRGKFNRINA